MSKRYTVRLGEKQLDTLLGALTRAEHEMESDSNTDNRAELRLIREVYRRIAEQTIWLERAAK